MTHFLLKYNSPFVTQDTPTARKNCSSNREKLFKFEAEGRKSLEQFIQTVKGQNNS